MRNIPVVGKFLTVFALFGICAILIAAYSAVQIKTIDKSYSDLIEHDSAAALNLALANHALLNGRAALADMMIAFTEEGNAAAEVEAKATRGEFAQLMDKAIASVPGDSRLPALKDEALRLYNVTCKNAWNLGRTASNVEEALASQKAFGMECQPVFARIGAKLTQIATEITTRNDTESGALTETSDQTALITVVAVILGFLTVVVAGYFAIRTWLVTPMQRLANGDLSANIDGTDRRDEVGTMAKAVQIFKDNEPEGPPAGSGCGPGARPVRSGPSKGRRYRPQARGGNGGGDKRSGRRPEAYGRRRPLLSADDAFRGGFRKPAGGLQYGRRSVEQDIALGCRGHGDDRWRLAGTEFECGRPVAPHRNTGRFAGGNSRRARPDNQQRQQFDEAHGRGAKRGGGGEPIGANLRSGRRKCG